VHSLANVATIPGAKGPMPRRNAADPLPTDDDDEFLREVAGMATRESSVQIPTGVVLDDTYEITREIGVGGMGVVYLAHDLKLHRDVAIKLHGAMAGEPGGERLLREASSLAQLVHPNVVTVHGVGTWAGHPYVAMEYVAGGTARAWLAQEKRTAREIIELFVAAGRGLAAAHARGLVHLDFKPDNVLVGDDGRVRVADFGLARAFTQTGDGDDTPAGAVRGTPGYIAPEQRVGALVGPPADQFAFAVALWEALAGERPFASTTERDVTAEAGKLRRSPPGTPRHVGAALGRALSADPAARFPSMDALLTALTRPPRRRVYAAAGALAVVALAVALFVATRPAHARRKHFPGPSLAGLWNGDFGYLYVREVDGEIVGVYDHDDGIIRGHMDGGRFVGKWCELPTREAPIDGGDVEMVIGRDKNGVLLVTGRWRYGDDGDWIGKWNLDEDRASPPAGLAARLDESLDLCKR
jgi:hypothetical protein